MAETTAISWADATLNFWIGCTKVSVGERGACEHCYAEEWAKRYRAHDVTWGDAPRVRTAESTWNQARTWNRKAARDGTRPFIFANSLSDTFDNQVDPQWRADAFALMRETPHLVWLLLTKRPQNIAKMAQAASGLPDNAAIGCTVVTQEEARRDIPHLLSVPGPLFRFLSIEPLLGQIDLGEMLRRGDAKLREIDPLAASMLHTAELERLAWVRPRVDWVICGGESGPHRREMDLDWARSLRDQCVAADVPFFFKQGTALRPGQLDTLDGVEWKQRQLAEASR